MPNHSQPDLNNRIPALCKQLKQLVHLDISDLESLLTTLEEENIALRERDAENITRLAQLKGKVTKQIEDRARAKVKLITASGAKIHAGKVGEGIASLGDTELTQLWSNSLELLGDCHAKNQINGLIIERSRQRNQKIMDMVRGKHTKPKLYGKGGQENAYAGSNSIAKA